MYFIEIKNSSFTLMLESASEGINDNKSYAQVRFIFKHPISALKYPVSGELLAVLDSRPIYPILQ